MRKITEKSVNAFLSGRNMSAGNMLVSSDAKMREIASFLDDHEKTFPNGCKVSKAEICFSSSPPDKLFPNGYWTIHLKAGKDNKAIYCPESGLRVTSYRVNWAYHVPWWVYYGLAQSKRLKAFFRRLAEKHPNNGPLCVVAYEVNDY